MTNLDLINQIANEEINNLGNNKGSQYLAAEIEDQLVELGYYIHLDDPVDLESVNAISQAANFALRKFR